MSATFRILPAQWPQDAGALRSVRDAVFIVEQRIAPQDEWDDLDDASRHVLAVDAAGQAIGCARLTPQRRIGRMAVLAAWRGHGVGMALLQHLVAEARALDWDEVQLSAQTHALPFYERAGFVAFGDLYQDAGIPHRMMRLPLRNAPDAMDTTAAQAAQDDQALSCDDQAQLVATTLRIITGAHRALALYSRDLEPGLLDRHEIVEALRRLAVRGRGVQIRILLQDAQPALRNGHRLLPLLQRLPSVFALREICEETDRQYAGAFILNDRGGFLARTLASRPQARGHSGARGRQAPLAAYFEQVWARAQAVAALRALPI